MFSHQTGNDPVPEREFGVHGDARFSHDTGANTRAWTEGQRSRRWDERDERKKRRREREKGGEETER